ncbi:hypothetical protein PL373_16045 [Tenacibaculum maritimum]|nr:hypothetical protein [Tenacibaculum maritimum]MDB0602614.1 hypothetical protein [Tenacibaculum maritimum]MDB0611275.1 hypothetical protein [Tenacibaculum maritimum]
MKSLSNKIVSTTGITSDELELLLFKTLMECITKEAKTPQNIQKLLHSKLINNWFKKQVTKANKKYLVAMKPYEGLNKEDLKIYYVHFIRRIRRNYPFGIIKSLTNNQVKPLEIHLN